MSSFVNDGKPRGTEIGKIEKSWTKAEWKETVPYCRNCAYMMRHEGNIGCGYLLAVGHSRGCEPGKDCIHRKENADG